MKVCKHRPAGVERGLAGRPRSTAHPLCTKAWHKEVQSGGQLLVLAGMQAAPGACLVPHPNPTHPSSSRIPGAPAKDVHGRRHHLLCTRPGGACMWQYRQKGQC